MGAPKRNRRTYEKPKNRWNLERIKADRALIEEYGLKNMRELWKAQTEISRIRSNARRLLAGAKGADQIKGQILERLAKLGVSTKTATLDDLLDLKVNALLNRRLQTIVFKKGMARTAKQARQLITHGFISIDGRRFNRPGNLTTVEDESRIGFYKPIDLSLPKSGPQAEPTVRSAAEVAAQPQEQEAKQAPEQAKA